MIEQYSLKFKLVKIVFFDLLRNTIEIECLLRKKKKDRETLDATFLSMKPISLWQHFKPQPQSTMHHDEVLGDARWSTYICIYPIVMLACARRTTAAHPPTVHETTPPSNTNFFECFSSALCFSSFYSFYRIYIAQ